MTAHLRIKSERHDRNVETVKSLRPSHTSSFDPVLIAVENDTSDGLPLPPITKPSVSQPYSAEEGGAGRLFLTDF